MKALTILAASLILSTSASAADSQVGASSAGATVAAAAAAPVQRVTINKGRTRAEVHAEAVDAVKHHKTALAVQLEQYR